MSRKNSNHPNVRMVNGSQQYMKVAESLRKEGFEQYTGMCMPEVTADASTPMQTWNDFISAEIRSAGNILEEGSALPRKGVPTLYFSSGNENKSGVEDCGTPNLGFIEWGFGNVLPNLVALLTNMLPYTSAGIKFNTDMLAGLGPQPMFDITQYVGGNITTKTIRYKDAGAYLRGQIADKQRELVKLQTEQQQAEGDGGAFVNTFASVVGNSVSDSIEELRKGINEEIETLKKDLETWEKTNEQLQYFLDENNLAHTWLALALDQMMFGICFSELQLNQQELDENGKPVETSVWKPRVTGISHRTCHTTRLERMDANGVINYVYCSNSWLDVPYRAQGGEPNAPITALPALNTTSPLVSLNAQVREAREKKVSVNDRPTRFVCPSVYPTVGRPYYPTPAWHSIFGGDIYEYLSTIISDRFNRKKNSNIIGRVIYMHHEYLMQLATQRDKDGNPKEIETVRNEFYQKINKWLSNRSNAGQSLLAFTFQGSDGKEHKSFEVVEIAAANKGTVEANEKETAEISSIVFMALGLDARLLGSSPLSLVGSNGGTDIRERFLLRQILMSPTQNIMLKPLEVVSRFNEWDRHLVWEIKREVMTTLDNSKTGVTTAETNE